MAGTAAAALALVSSCDSSAKRKAKARPGGFKIGVCDWTIGKRSDPASLEVAKRIGLDGVQVDIGRGQDDLPLFDPGLQQKFIEARQAHQVEIASLALGVLNDIPYKSDPRAERWVDKSIDVCKALSVNVVLLAFFANGDLRDDSKGTDVVVERFKKVAPKAEDAGVALAIESWLSAEQHMEIIERVGSPAVKVYYDVANSNKAGYDIYSEIRQLGKLICEFHAKDYDDLYGKGSIDFPRVRQAMDDIRYRGWFVMEGTKMPLGVEESCRYDAEYLRGIFPAKV
ncbi:MAG: sugar phosphate isomerase/epimerase [Phycisphaerae bacterium]|nr:sugar phosphate isomerase/epimerase [Phycisphaerae bacterium]